jgi:multidrug/hemolysin transport system permease protein
VTVAFCSNFLIVQDKALGNMKDISISSVNKTILSISYYISSIISTLIICFIAMIGCLIYIASVGWYLSFSDILLLFLDVVLLVLFGTAVSSVINHFLTSLGQISAVGTIVSSGYGFLCGAYMPVSQFGIGLQKVLSFFPGTYGTSLVRTHAMQGPLLALEKDGVPSDMLQGISDMMDCDIYFFDVRVDDITKYIVLISSIILSLLISVLLNKYKKEK